MATSTLKTLQAATKGLLYPSEQDHPVKAFVWPKADIGDAPLNAVLVKKQAKADLSEKVTEQSVADFFAPVTQEQTWQNEAEKNAVHQFQALHSALNQFTNLTVFRIGDQQIYVVGQTPEGDLAGVSTVVVET